MGIKWVDNHIEVELPKKCKKITGTRFASILNKNVWSSPFQVWCEITKTYEPPYEDTIYTIAGKVIESKQINYMKKAYYMTNLKTPTDIFGVDFFKKTYGDFYHDEPIFGGMWDSLLYEDDKPDTVLEFKTTKRSEDWQDGKVPEYYALQAALYAYLLHVEKVIMVCSFLDEKDYPVQNGTNFDCTPTEKFVPNASNTVVRTFNVHEKFPDFDSWVNDARIFYENYIAKGISPDYDEKTDADYLKELRKNNLNPTTDISKLVEEIETLDKEINNVISTVAEKQKELKTKTELLKEHLTSQLRDGDKQVVVKGKAYEFILSRTETKGIDKELLKKDGLLARYEKVTQGVRFTNKEIKGE